MKRFSDRLWAAAASRALTPIVMGLFLLLYIGIAFRTEDALIALIAITQKNVFLVLLFSLIPLNMALRLVKETITRVAVRRSIAGKTAKVPWDSFDESVELSAAPSLPEVAGRLNPLGYTTCRTPWGVTASRGIGTYPARFLFLAGMVCLFTGVLISLGARTSLRGTIVEGEELPTEYGAGSTVQRIIVAESAGLFLGKTLSIVTAPSGGGKGNEFGLYPPGRHGGAFVYPRYLGLGVVVRFNAPDLQRIYEEPVVLNLFPPGREAAVSIAGSPYRILFSVTNPEDGTDPYMTGRIEFNYKVLKGKEVAFTGKSPIGATYAHPPYTLAIPEVRRVVITDFIHDNGVPLIWLAGIEFLAAGILWFPIRIFFPRREMLFIDRGDVVQASSRAEGRRRKHSSIFHETLDHLDSKRGGKT